MADQLHYTSAVTGLAGRPGFQFVAASPAATATVQQAVAPYLGYRPPPAAPPRPTPAQIARFPVAYSFASDGDAAILVQCRYLGADYSGRYGNFLGHAVVADRAELTDAAGLHPIELWGSPLWATAPAGHPALPALADLPPGADIEPNAVADWLAAAGEPERYALLAELIDAVLAGLDGHGGQVILVADQVETVVRWIAAVSFSLPPSRVWELSFLTYAADPDRSRQRLVGTTTDAWAGGDTQARVFQLDRPAGRPRRPTGRYPAALAGEWQRGDLGGIDALNAFLTTATGGDPGRMETLMAVVALSRGDRLSEAEAAAVALTLPGCQDRLPAGIWDGLAAHTTVAVGLPLALALHHTAWRIGHDALADRAGSVAVALAIGDPDQRARIGEVHLSPGAAAHAAIAPALSAALREAADLDDVDDLMRLARRLDVPVPSAAVRAGTARAVRADPRQPERVAQLVAAADDPPVRAGLLHGMVDALVGASAKAIGLLLTDALCDRVYELLDRDWDGSPRVWSHVLASYGRRHPDQRVGVTDLLTDLAARGLLPGRDVDDRLAEVWRRPAPAVDECLGLVGEGGRLDPDRARQRVILDLVRRSLVAGDITTPAAYALASRFRQLQEGSTSEHPGDADAGAVVAAHRVAAGDPAGGLPALDRVHKAATGSVYEAAVGLALAGVRRAAPAELAAGLAALPDNGLRKLVTKQVADLAHRGPAAQLRLVEVAIRLWRTGLAAPILTGHAVRLTRAGATARQLRAALADRDHRLLDDLDAMRHEYDRALAPPPRRSLRRRGR